MIYLGNPNSAKSHKITHNYLTRSAVYPSCAGTIRSAKKDLSLYKPRTCQSFLGTVRLRTIKPLPDTNSRHRSHETCSARYHSYRLLSMRPPLHMLLRVPLSLLCSCQIFLEQWQESLKTPTQPCKPKRPTWKF